MATKSGLALLLGAAALMALLLCLSPTNAEIMGSCDHDEVMARMGTRRSFGRHNQTYETVGRRRAKGNLRIFVSADLTGMSDADKTLYTSTILPMALNTLSSLLYVNSVQGNLFLPRDCISFWGNGACAQYTTSTCGTTTIPTDYLGAGSLCSTSSTSCTPIAAGTGIPNADMIMFFTYGSTGCGSSTLAYASYCDRDQNDRPISGYSNICPLLLTSSYSNEDKAKVLIHEISHSLGVSSGHFPFYRFPDGKSRSPRDSNGNPFIVNGYYASSSNTVKQFTERGGTVNKIVTPRVMQEFILHTKCLTVNGVELENAGGSGTAGSHWEGRQVMQEYMTGSLKTNAVISTLTLALFEDSGWYYPDYSKATTLQWGRKKGCASVNQACISGGVSVESSMFCTDQTQSAACTSDYLSRGVCAIYTYSSALPVQNQYFSGSTTLGGSSETDYCPYVMGYSNGLCTDSSLQPSTNYYGETYGTGSRCIMSQMLLSGYIPQPTKPYGRCYKTSCVLASGVPTLQVTIGSSTYSCTTTGAQFTVSGYSGFFVCPNVLDICPDIMCSCPNGKCVEGVCRVAGPSA